MTLQLVRPLLYLLLLLLSLPPNPGTAADQAPDPNPPMVTDPRLQQEQKKILRIQEGIRGHQEKIDQAREEEHDILAELEEMTNELREKRAGLARLQSDLDLQEQNINLLQTELQGVVADSDKLKEHLRKRLAAFYRMGSIGYMNVIFSTSSLPDLLNFQEHFRYLLRHDQEIVLRYRRQLARLTESRTTLDRGKGELLAVIVDIKNQEEEISATRQKRADLLAKVQTEKKLYEQALTAMETAAAKLTRTMEQIKAANRATENKAREDEMQSAKKRRPKPRPQGIVARKGNLPPPIRGQVTTFFGRHADGKFGISTYANGIDIKPGGKSDIQAIYEGRVVFAGKLRGYGNMIIIDHGQQYYSLVSRASTLSKAKDDQVGQGEVIGTIDEESGLLADGLHFEIRHGTTPENPLHWLDNGMLSINHR